MESTKALAKLPNEASYVLLSNYGRFPRDDHSVFRKNTDMTKNFIAGISSKAPRSVIFTSSVCMYGRPPVKIPCKESQGIDPTHYGLSKFVSENLLKLNLSCPLTILRIPGTYGPGDKGKSVVASFMEKIKDNKEIVLTGDGSQKRDFLYVGDVVSGITNFLEKPENTVVNFTSGQSLSLNDLVGVIGRHFNVDPKVSYHGDSSKEFDLTFDRSKILELMPSFVPTKIEDGIKNM